ncbi:MAG: alanine--tRNA ligase [Proteobacteria bacterium]|jgi:alanyl-tRNA synthetase|nr:alanine--tRNA ligase [Pseudomonadota bacterium]
MKTSEIRESFLAFFERAGHQRVASSSLVPDGDKTLLFTNAGMVPFKDVFLGADQRDYLRATSSQRCVRAGGKHNDLENVGYTARHHTFFEMLGNFSFGDYFKKEAIQYAWEFLTVELGLPADKLWITVFDEDAEAEQIWLEDIGISKNQLSRIGAKDNFWSMGDTGPCGPCSEIFYDHGADVAGGPPGSPEEDGDRYIEIWNLVFMQYNRDADGELTPLPKPSVDTGMGLERMAAVMQKVHNNYEIDLFENIISVILTHVDISDTSNHSVRVIADHIRSCSFLIADGVLPSNEGRGYVLRRIVRRAVRHGQQIGADSPFFFKIVDELVKEMGDAYPELVANSSVIKDTLKKEELRFAETLEQGLKILDSKLADSSADQVSGDLAFLLYDTYGFPVDLTADVARERGITIDMPGFDRLMNEQRERARAGSSFAATDGTIYEKLTSTDFVGYADLTAESKVLALFSDGNAVDVLDAGTKAHVVLGSTPFYAESGGQVGDQGELFTSKANFSVSDVKKVGSATFAHFGKLESGALKVGDTVKAQVNSDTRSQTAANHSATHLLHAALKRVLGDHVEQKGSLVDSTRLRFDFAHGEAVTAVQICEIEKLVNRQIIANHLVETRLMTIDEARESGAAALFGEKYGDEVRVVGMSEFSLELCGGTHVSRTGDIGCFFITAESGVAAGVRRIEGLTGIAALAYINTQRHFVSEVSAHLRTPADQLLSKVVALQSRIKELEKENKQLKKGGGTANNLDDQVQDIGEVRALLARVDDMSSEAMREIIDHYRDKLSNGVIVLVSEVDGKGRMIAGASQAINKQYPAGKLIQHIASNMGGRGGGRPDMAEGGLPNDEPLDKALKLAQQWIEAGGKA